MKKRVPVICICGSTRFADMHAMKRWEFEKQGIIALSINILPSSYAIGAHIAEEEGVKEVLDELHLRKIDMSDEVFIVNVGGYIGESTKAEIEYAKLMKKPVI